MKQVIVLSGLLAVALVGSYLTWTSEEVAESPTDQVEVYKAGATDLGKLTWKSEKATIEVEKKTDPKGEYVWVVATEKRTKKAPGAPADAEEEDAHGEDAEVEDEDEEPVEAPTAEPGAAEGAAAGEAPPEEEVEVKVTRFRGNDAANEMWTSFAPLQALRELGSVAALDKAVLGLDAPTGTVEVQRRDGTLELVVGGETYGAKDRFVASGDKVYLVDDAVLRPLQYATTRLVERSLQPLAEADIEKVEVRLPDGRTATMIQQNRDDKAKAFWAMESAPDEEDSTGGTWLGKLLKLRVSAYVSDDEIEGQLSPVFTYGVHGDGQSWFVEILEAGAATGGGGGEYYARPEFSRSMVKLTRSLAADAAEDLEAIFPE